MGYKVNILLSTYNGEKYLKEQLDSILNQRGVDIFLTVRDDGSKDKTVEILQDYEKFHSNIKVFAESNIGWKKSFIKLLSMADKECDFFAFADQDDVWMEEKTIKAIEHIDVNNSPMLYQSKTILVNEDLKMLPDNKIYEEPNNINVALLNSWSQGCGMVFNKKACEMAASYIPNDNAAHDMWVYLICYFFGDIYNDPENSYVLYRQHAANVTAGTAGGHRIWTKKFMKQQIIKMKQNTLYSNYGKDIYEGFLDELNEPEKKVLIMWSEYSKKLSYKIKLMIDPTVRRRSVLGTLGLKYAILTSQF